MTAPTREQREEWRKLPEILLAEADISDRPGSWSRLISASTTARGLLLALDAAEERLAEIAATALTVERERDEALVALRASAEWLALTGYPIQFEMPELAPPVHLWNALVDVVHEDRDGRWHGNKLTREGVDDWLCSEAGVGGGDS